MRTRFRHWFRPRQLVITDSSSGKAARHVVVRPLRLIIPLLLLIGAGFAAGLYFSPEPDTTAWTYRLSQLEQEKNDLMTQAAEKDATLALRNDEIDSLKQELDSLRQTLATARTKLGLLDNILNKRKEQGISIVNAKTRWLDDKRIGFKLVLVKGGNYPRRVSGHLLLAATNLAGEVIQLTSPDQPDGLPYEMDDHTLLQGSVDWKEDWKPEQLTFIVMNHRNREVTRKDVAIERIPDVTQ